MDRPGGVRRALLALATAPAVALAAALAGCGSDPDTTTGSATRAAVEDITVAAASDLRVAFEELGASFTDATGTEVTFSFGSSGQLKQQVLNGAPFDVFASANVAFVDEVVAAGRADGATQATYGFGRIVVYTDSPGPNAVTTLDGLAAAEVRNVAIANPEHAPYGLAAEQALRAVGVWDEVRPKLVLGENVSDTLRLATTGNADVAIVALSLVAAVDDGTWTLVDDALHEPLEQALVATDVDPTKAEAARAFVDHVTSPAGREVLRRYGFVLPDEGAG
ncbi:MAG: molybdate ABC transporter substrate-binding protein [Acidimicrobiia bacterium]|nr:molybdate ABC transporter substrate-binding protein [Acidimicrobiia bacterium]